MARLTLSQSCFLSARIPLACSASKLSFNFRGFVFRVFAMSHIVEHALGIRDLLPGIAGQRRRGRARRRDLEREAQRGNAITGMIVGVGELREPVELLSALC